METTRIKDIVQGKQEYPVKSKKFWVPDLQKIAPYIEAELKKNFENIIINII